MTLNDVFKMKSGETKRERCVEYHVRAILRHFSRHIHVCDTHFSSNLISMKEKDINVVTGNPSTSGKFLFRTFFLFQIS